MSTPDLAVVFPPGGIVLGALQWCAAGIGEAAKQFRRVNGFLHLLGSFPPPLMLTAATLPHRNAMV